MLRRTVSLRLAFAGALSCGATRGEDLDRNLEPCGCPAETFEVLQDGKPFCSCPEAYDCEGCGLACTAEPLASGWRGNSDGAKQPFRCVQGFYRSAATLDLPRDPRSPVENSCMTATCRAPDTLPKLPGG